MGTNERSKWKPKEDKEQKEEITTKRLTLYLENCPKEFPLDEQNRPVLARLKFSVVNQSKIKKLPNGKYAE